MIRLPLMTKPEPPMRRTGSNRQGASQTGDWAKVIICMTDRSGSAAIPAAPEISSRANNRDCLNTWGQSRGASFRSSNSLNLERDQFRLGKQAKGQLQQGPRLEVVRRKASGVRG